MHSFSPLVTWACWYEGSSVNLFYIHRIVNKLHDYSLLGLQKQNQTLHEQTDKMVYSLSTGLIKACVNFHGSMHNFMNNMQISLCTSLITNFAIKFCLRLIE